MTRINSNIPPSELKQKHLVAELREITMVPAALRRSLRAKHPDDILRSIPKEFTLNTGHVKFFYNKLLFLQKRFHLLVEEMIKRGYNPDITRIQAFDGFDKIWYQDWMPTPEADATIRQRIQQRINEKPHLYKQ